MCAACDVFTRKAKQWRGARFSVGVYSVGGGVVGGAAIDTACTSGGVVVEDREQSAIRDETDDDGAYCMGERTEVKGRHIAVVQEERAAGDMSESSHADGGGVGLTVESQYVQNQSGGESLASSGAL